MRNLPKVSLLALGLLCTSLASAEPSRERNNDPPTIEVVPQVIHGRAQKPYLIFHVVKRPFQFEVGTARYSWRPPPGSKHERRAR